MALENIQIAGESYQYAVGRPSAIGGATRILALTDPSNTPSAAEAVIASWSAYAEDHDLLLVSPIFDAPRFEAPGGATFRGLYGKYIGADDLLLRIAEKIAEEEKIPRSMYLFGHSATGMFAARFAVRHPQRLIGGIIESAGRFAYPKDVGWALGWGDAPKEHDWGDGVVNRFTVTVDKNAFLTASLLPLTVLVGENDTLPWVLENEPEAETKYRLHYPGQVGTDPMTIGEAWVVYMQLLAAKNRMPSNIQFVSVQNQAHGASGLRPHAQEELLRPFIVPVSSFAVRAASSISRAFGDFSIARSGQLELYTAGGWSAVILFTAETPDEAWSTYDPDRRRLLLALTEDLMAPCLSIVQSPDAYLRIYPHAPNLSMLYTDAGRLHVLPPKRVG